VGVPAEPLVCPSRCHVALLGTARKGRSEDGQADAGLIASRGRYGNKQKRPPPDGGGLFAVRVGYWPVTVLLYADFALVPAAFFAATLKRHLPTRVSGNL
jgi:hypothetical protein